jgi:hypothetical protein
LLRATGRSATVDDLLAGSENLIFSRELIVQLRDGYQI